MTQLVVVAFDELDDAHEALVGLRALEREGRVEIEDAALVEREEDGIAHVMDEESEATESAMLVGPLLRDTVAFMFPLAGVILADASAAAIGEALHPGGRRDFVDEVKATFRPGRSAIFLVVKDADADTTMAALGPHGGEVVQTTLSPEVEQSLRQTLTQDPVPAGQ